jgi:hypothetical protein
MEDKIFRGLGGVGERPHRRELNHFQISDRGFHSEFAFPIATLHIPEMLKTFPDLVKTAAGLFVKDRSNAYDFRPNIWGPAPPFDGGASSVFGNLAQPACCSDSTHRVPRAFLELILLPL